MSRSFNRTPQSCALSRRMAALGRPHCHCRLGRPRAAILPTIVFLLACVSMLLAGGCGRRDESLADVHGDVTFCGQPAEAEVLFEPLGDSGKSSGHPSTATTDASGGFRLSFSDELSGAKIGRHRVTIRVHRLPKPSGSESKSGSAGEAVGPLKVAQMIREVRSGSNQFHFRLTF